MKLIEVAAGLILHEGRYLIARRKAGVHLGGMWEFPGGKREGGESLVDCLHRELREELNILVRDPVPFQMVRHEYPEKTVELHFFHCRMEGGDVIPLECAEVRWVLPSELEAFDFPAADQTVIRALQQAAGRPA